MTHNDEFLTIAEAADLLSVHPETLRRWDKRGTLTAVRINDRGDRRWRKQDILAFLQQKNRRKIITYKNYEVIPYSGGFNSFTSRLGLMATYVIRKGDEQIVFAFAVAGLELFARVKPNDINLDELARRTIKNIIDREQKQLNDEDIYTFDFKNERFVQVLYPDWWEGPIEITLVKGLRASIVSINPTGGSTEAWRSVVSFKAKQGGVWFTTEFGPKREYFRYFVEVSGEYLKDKANLPPSSRGAMVFSLKYIKKRFNQTRDENDDRSIERITEDKVACWAGRCVRNSYIPSEES